MPEFAEATIWLFSNEYWARLKVTCWIFASSFDVEIFRLLKMRNEEVSVDFYTSWRSHPPHSQIVHVVRKIFLTRLSLFLLFYITFYCTIKCCVPPPLGSEWILWYFLWKFHSKYLHTASGLHELMFASVWFVSKLDESTLDNLVWIQSHEH